MRVSGAILLLLLTLASTCKDALVFLMFKANQSNIIETLCINRTEPMNTCHGKCFLKDKLQENRDQQANKSIPPKVFEQITVFTGRYFSLDFNFLSLRPGSAYSWYTENHWSFDYVTRLLRPPIFS